MANKKNDELVEKIRKLLALAANNPNEHEAGLALETAHRMMREHGVRDISSKVEEDIEIERWTTGELSQLDTYAGWLAVATAKLFDCRCWRTSLGARKGYRLNVSFAGESADLALAIEVWPYLVRLAGDSAKAVLGKRWSSSHRVFAESFAIAIQNRVKKIKAGDESDQEYGLVLVKKGNALNQYLASIGLEKLKPRKSKASYMKTEEEFRAAQFGYKMGEDVNLNFRKQVNGSTESVKLLGQ